MSTQEKPWYFKPAAEDGGWRSQPRTLGEIGLDPLTQARVLEWFALKIWVAEQEGSGEREYYGKSYDPLTIEMGTNGHLVAHSYVFDLGDGGRHHDFRSLADLEEALTEELIGGVEWAVRHGREGCEEVVARDMWLKDNPDGAEAWDGYTLGWETTRPYYERARTYLKGEDA